MPGPTPMHNTFSLLNAHTHPPHIVPQSRTSVPNHITLFLNVKRPHAHITSPLRFLYPTNILSRNRIPRRHVFLHALRETRFFLFREGASGGRDAFIEAVHVKFLRERQRESEGLLGSSLVRGRETRGGCTAISWRALLTAASCFI